MDWIYEYLFPCLWLLYLVYWTAVSFKVKATKRLESASSRILRSVIFACAILLLCDRELPITVLYRQLFSAGPGPFFAGTAITIAGLLFSVWARLFLGRNWSRSVTIKQDHELITSGPYALVRHPIYTGILAGFLGTALAIAQVRGFLAFFLILIALSFKLRLEEQWMHSHFGKIYEDYARGVPALLPRPF
jgi:protein-S-isoprenylcysteine O-methyltransferase Ste14